MTLPSIHECAAAFERLSPEMAIAAAGSVLVLGLAGLVVLAMRRAQAPPAMKYGCWDLPASFCCPFCRSYCPAGMSFRASAQGASPSIDAVEEAAVLSFPAPPSAQSHSTTPNQDTIMNTTNDSPSAASPQSANYASLPFTTDPSRLDGVPLSSSTVATRSPLPWSLWAIMCWAIGSLLVLCRVLLGHLSLWSLRRRCSQVTRGELFDLLNACARNWGSADVFELLTSPARTMPMTWGLCAPGCSSPNRRPPGPWPNGGMCCSTSSATSNAATASPNSSRKSHALCTGSTRWPGSPAGACRSSASAPATTSSSNAAPKPPPMPGTCCKASVSIQAFDSPEPPSPWHAPQRSKSGCTRNPRPPRQPPRPHRTRQPRRNSRTSLSTHPRGRPQGATTPARRARSIAAQSNPPAKAVPRERPQRAPSEADSEHAASVARRAGARHG